MSQAVLLFGSETWVLLASMESKIEGSHTVFLREIMEKRLWEIADGTSEKPRAEVVQEAAGTQSSMTCIGR